MGDAARAMWANNTFQGSRHLPKREPFSRSAVIISLGSYSVKVKLMDEEWDEIPPFVVKGNSKVYGEKALNRAKRSKNIELQSPFKNGLLADTKIMKKFFKLAFKEMFVDKAVLICEPIPLSTAEWDLATQLRKDLAMYLRNEMNIEAIFVAPQPLLSIFKLKRPPPELGSETGVVIDIGHMSTKLSVVLRGKTLPMCTTSSPIAGHFIEELLKKELALKTGGKIIEDRSIATNIKWAHCFVSDNIEEAKEKIAASDEEFLDTIRRSVVIDRKEIFLDKERFMVPEVLFDPTVIQTGYSEKDSLGNLVLRARKIYEQFRMERINMGNTDYEDPVASTVFRHFVIVGGSLKMEGMSGRVEAEVRNTMARYQYRLNNPDENDFDQEAFETLRNEMPLSIYKEMNAVDAGREAMKGGLRFVDEEENERWIYRVELERSAECLLERCPK